ncbi:3 4-dihydroxy-2-butanone 4-phosphate synthase [Bienertia sinuspersici]
MVHLKDFVDGKCRYLALVDCEDDLPKLGTCLAVQPSLFRPSNRTESLVNSQFFRKNMLLVVKLKNMDAYMLQNMKLDRDVTTNKPPLLGRSIVSGATKWKSNTCPSMNMLHTMAGELSTSLLDLYKLGGLPISGGIYYEVVLNCSTSKIEKGVSVQLWVDFWFKRSISYSAPVKRKRYTGFPPKSIHNPSGKLEDQPLEWLTKELDLFNSLGIKVEGSLEITYVVAFLSCWLCVFVLPENENRLIRPGTFEVAILIERGETYSIAIAVLASIYRGLNDPSPPGPLMVSISGAQGSKFFKDVKVLRVIHKGSGAKVECTMLNKNKNIFLFNDDNLDHIQMSYLSSLRSGYVSLCYYDSFFIEPHLPYRFSMQYSFCQGISSAITRKVQDRSTMSYDKVLMF